MSHLLEDSSGDPTYVEDFLLTHRIFIDTPLIVCSKLLEWFVVFSPRTSIKSDPFVSSFFSSNEIEPD